MHNIYKSHKLDITKKRGNMNKYIGYGIAVVGIIIAVLSFQADKISFLSSIKEYYIMIAGIVIIGAGVALSMMDKSTAKPTQSEEEVPIYVGTGKYRKIVGYRKN